MMLVLGHLFVLVWRIYHRCLSHNSNYKAPENPLLPRSRNRARSYVLKPEYLWHPAHYAARLCGVFI